MTPRFRLLKNVKTPILYFFFSTVAFAQNPAPANSETSLGKKHMQAGVYALREAQDFELASRKQLQESNNLRRQLLQARRQETTQALNRSSNSRAATQQIELLQQQGNALRNQASARQLKALEQFTLGLQDLWPDWIKTTEYFTARPIVNAATSLNIQAHNTPERSVHPGMENTSSAIQAVQSDSMSLLLNSAPTQKPLMALDRSTFQLSRDNQFIGHIESQTAASKLPHTIPINEIHRWRLVLSDLQGNAIENAEIQFLGHMPGHVHGLPTQPKITDELAPGVYDVSGVKFQMQGWWVIDFEVNVNGLSDVLRFNLVL